MKRAFAHWFLILGAVAYIAVANIPTEWLWFDPGTPVFSDVTEGQVPQLTYSRVIKVAALISYSTKTRRVVDGQGAVGLAECSGNNGNGFQYDPANGPVVGKDLVWWSGNDPNCARLSVGNHYTSTTWAIEKPMRYLLPEWARGTIFDSVLPRKTVTRHSPAFTVSPEM